MTEPAVPPDSILAGRRALDGMPAVEIVRDWVWFESVARWAVCIRLTPGDLHDHEAVPTSTDWYVLLEADYPWGTIEFHPAAEDGLLRTFPHQSYNGRGNDGLPWRSGNICLSTPARALGRSAHQSEPGEAHSRLRWYVLRALEWLALASRDELLVVGEPFELPQVPVQGGDDRIVVFAEGADDLRCWRDVHQRVGLVDLSAVRREPEILAATCFRSRSGQPLITSVWGRSVSGDSDSVSQGIWLRLPDIMRLPPWQAPTTWGELREVGAAQDLSIDELLQQVVPKLRDGKDHILLVGFPLPAIVGEPTQEMHWQAMELPRLTREGSTVAGFRPTETGWWRRDRSTLLANGIRLAWLASENWHPEHLASRGRLPEAARAKKIALVGAGALGSAVGELLVRAGLTDMVIVDGDVLSGGNLVRHTLGLAQIGSKKAKGLMARLNDASPHAAVTGIATRFPPSRERERVQLNSCNVVLDCTGSDDVLGRMEAFPWGTPRLFISLSLGYRARRLFCFVAQDTAFPRVAFSNLLAPWLERELRENGDYPWEGVGCWHPVFPARSDDIWLMAAAAVRAVEPYLVRPPEHPELIVFEQSEEAGVFAGIRRAGSLATRA